MVFPGDVHIVGTVVARIKAQQQFQVWGLPHRPRAQDRLRSLDTVGQEGRRPVLAVLLSFPKVDGERVAFVP